MFQSLVSRSQMGPQPDLTQRIRSVAAFTSFRNVQCEHGDERANRLGAPPLLCHRGGCGLWGGFSLVIGGGGWGGWGGEVLFQQRGHSGNFVVATSCEVFFSIDRDFSQYGRL